MRKDKKTESSSRKRLTREHVLSTAIQIADKEGIDGLSMRKLAFALEVEAMSLYNHVANKNDLLAGMVDLVVAEIYVPDVNGYWKDEMRRRSLSAHKTLLSHPWAIILMMSQSDVGPAMIRYVDATIGSLYKGGFSYINADRAWNLIDSHIYGFTLQEINFPFEPSEFGEKAEEFLPRLTENEFPYLRGLATQVIDGSYDGKHDFNFGLELILIALGKI